jgi:hypothetical protein
VPKSIVFKIDASLNNNAHWNARFLAARDRWNLAGSDVNFVQTVGNTFDFHSKVHEHAGHAVVLWFKTCPPNAGHQKCSCRVHGMRQTWQT